MELLALVIILGLAAGIVLLAGGNTLVAKLAQIGGIAYLLTVLLTIVKFLLKS